MKIARKRLYGYLSFLTAFMILLSGVIPTISVVIKAEERITNSSGQVICDYVISLISGAENKGTLQDPDFVWAPSSYQKDHRFVYQINYSMSGEGDFFPESLKISVPKHILKDRSEEYADSCEISVPEVSVVPPGDTENLFVYIERENDYLIYNRLTVSAAEIGVIQYAYNTTETTFEYRDTDVSDQGRVEFSVDSANEHIDSVSSMPAVRIDTSAVIISSGQRFCEQYPDWQTKWGRAADYGISRPEDYYYIVWEVVDRVKATQPYSLTHDLDLNGTFGDTTPVAIKVDNGSWSADFTIGELRVTDRDMYSYIITKYPKSSYGTDLKYTITDRVTSIVAPYDNIDVPTSRISTAFYQYERPKAKYPVGGGDFWKHNSYGDFRNTNVVNYQLTEFVNHEIDSITSNLFFHLCGQSNAYTWTILNGHPITDIESYGKRDVTFILTDEEFFFNDSVTKSTVPEGTERLDSNDYEITAINYEMVFTGAKWDDTILEFIRAIPEYTDEDAACFYAKFGNDEEWSEIGIYHLKSSEREILRSDKIASWEGDTIVFRDGAECVGYRIVAANNFYHTRLEATPYCKLKHSERIDSLIAAQYEKGEKKSWLTNRACMKVYANDTEEVSDDTLILDMTDLARDYIIGYERETEFKKETTFFSNDKIKQVVTLGWKTVLSESYMTQDGREYVPQRSGTFYDLLPMGSTIDTSSVAVSANGVYLRESRYSVSTVINYNNTGRTLLIVRIDEQTDKDYVLTYSTLHTWESVIDYGKTVHNSIAYETGNGTLAGGFPDNGGTITDAALMRDLDPSTDENRFVYTDHNAVINIIVAAYSGLNKTIKNSSDYKYSRETIVVQNEIYEYKLRYANSYINLSRDVILYDNLESFTSDDNIPSQWHGKLQAIDLSQPQSLGADPVVYLSRETLDINAPENRDLTDTDKWLPLENFGDVSAARSIAVDLSKDKSGRDFVLEKNGSVAVILYMKAPASSPDVELSEGQLSPQAFNDVYISGTLKNLLTDEVTPDCLINWQYDTADLRIMADIPIRKVDSEDPDKPVDGISFRLSGISDYGTVVDRIIESGVNGNLTFKKIEKGTYTLFEVSGSPDYQRINSTFTVTINNFGEIIFNEVKVEDGDDPVIADPPRIHTDIKFNKRDLAEKGRIIEGVEFRLYGTSDYHNYVNKYAFSDKSGIVEFDDIELGTYTLEEISSVEGYIRSDEQLEVRVDENGRFGISGSYMEKDGTLTIYNEPLHSFTIQKESYTMIGGVYNPVGGAVFRLYGVSDYGTEVSITKTTLSSGKAVFSGLEPGSSYVIEEISAPEGYAKDDTKRIVKITSEGTVTISSIEVNEAGNHVFKNKENSTITVTKNWVDEETNETREAEPVIHIGVDNRIPDAYFAGNGSTSVLAKVTDLSNIKRFVPYTGDDEDAVQALIDNGTAKKIDDGSTDKVIYAWYVSDTNAADYGTVYWWSDAVTVYLTTKANKMWKGLANVTFIDVSDINTSECLSMESMFANCSSLKSINGLKSWDVSSVKNMKNMFSSCTALTSLDMTGWDVSSVTDMYRMFYSCTALVNIGGTAGWDVSSVKQMAGMFEECSSLKSLDFSDWGDTSFLYMSKMFYNCSELTSIIGIDKWDMSQADAMTQMFYNCKKLTSLDLTGWKVASVTDIYGLFNGCSSLKNIYGITGWDLTGTQSVNYLFKDCTSLVELDLRDWNVSRLTSLFWVFSGCTSLKTLNVSGWDVSSVTDFSCLFYNCSSLSSLIGISEWKTSSATKMYVMFRGCGKLTTLDLSNWDVSKVTDMNQIFLYCGSLKTLDLSGWNVSKVKNMDYMFYNDSNLTTIYVTPIWDVSNVTVYSYMFYGCSRLKGGNGTTYSGSYVDKTYARIDKPGQKGYLTEGTISVETDAAYFGRNGSSSVLSKVTSTSNIKRFAHYTGDEAAVQALISNETAKKIDDGRTDKNIYAWYISDSSASDYGTVYWWSDTDNVYLLTESNQIWQYLYNVTVIDVSGINTSKCTDMSNMFRSDNKLTDIIGINSMDVSAVTSMQNMFNSCSSLRSLYLGGWNTSSVRSMTAMFYSCSNLSDLYGLNNWDASSLTTTYLMFMECTSLITVNLRGWNTPELKNIGEMYEYCSSLISVDMTGWDTSSVTSTVYMFQYCSKLRTITGMGGWDMSSVRHAFDMFYGCSSLRSVGDLSGWRLSSVTDAKWMFANCSSLSSIGDISMWGMSSATDMSYMFSGCSSLSNIGNLSGWDVSCSTNLSYLFSGCSNLTSLDLSDWKTGMVQSISYMFRDCSSLKDVKMGGWDLSSLNYMSSVFSGCSSLKNIDMSGWKLLTVTSVSGLFSGLSALEAVDLSGWITFPVTSMSSMFNGCSSLKSLDLRSWDTSSVTNMSNLFSGCSSLTTIYASSMWNISNVSSSTDMFKDCTVLTGGNGTPFDSGYTDKYYARIDEVDTPGYLTFEYATIGIIEVYDSTDPRCIMTKVTDSMWTYLFTELDPTLDYCTWEDVIEEYSSENMGKKKAAPVVNNTAAITNYKGELPDPPAYGNLKLTETIIIRHNGQVVQTADMKKTFLFTVTLRDENGSVPEDNIFIASRTEKGQTYDSSVVMTDGVIKFRLGHSDDLTIYDIPENYTFSVVQTVEDGFDMAVTEGTANGTIVADTTKTVGITNTKETDDITFRVKKQVTGNVVDPEEKFAFLISLSGLNANGLYEVVSSNHQESVILTANAAGNAYMETEIVDGEILTFTVPKNSSYTVLEKAGAYTSSYQVIDNNELNLISKSADSNYEENKSLSTQSETADDGEDIIIVFTNKKYVKQALTLTKKLINANDGNDDLFGFTVGITGLEAREILTSSLGRLVADDEGAVSVTFRLSDGDTMRINGIPVGAKNEVTEDASDYTASYEILDGDQVLFSGANTEPNGSLGTGPVTVAAGQDHDVIFTNSKSSCDITVTKMVDPSAEVVYNDYSTHEFYFDVELHGLESANRKYSEFIVEYSAPNTTGTIRKTLAQILELDKTQADAIADDAVFTVALRHGEAFRLRALPKDASFFVTEHVDVDYIFAYTVTSNDGAVLQTEARANDRKNTALPLNATELVDSTDTDIRYVFTAVTSETPYVLPASGFEDQRPLLLLLLSGMVGFFSVCWFVLRKNKAD